MDRPKQLVFVRHAESARNKAKAGNRYFLDEENRQSLVGVPDQKIPITELGVAQARQTGIALRERFGTFDYAYTSGYTRTNQTLDHILEAYTDEERAQIQVRHNPFIRERDSGYTYDMTTEEAETAFPWLQPYWDTFGGFMARPPGGESLADVTNRVYTFIGMLFRDRADQNVLAVIHGGTLRCVRFLLERWDYDQATTFNNEPHPENCGMTSYNFDDDLGRLVLQNYNEIAYDMSQLVPGA